MNTFGGSEIGVFERVSLGLIRHPPRMVRDSFGDLNDLVASIREKGLLEPIVVRPKGDLFEVIAGNRRLEACKRLHKKRVACHIVMADDISSYEMSLIENVQRQSMHPLEEAMAFEKYVDDYGFGGVADLARKIGKSETFVSRRIALLDLPGSVKKSMMEGKLSAAIAQELIAMPKESAVSLARLALDESLSREEIRSIVRMRPELRGNPQQPEATATADRRRIERVLKKNVTAMRVCMMRMDYTISTLEERDWIFKEAISECRRTTHAMMDRLIKLDLRYDTIGSESLGRVSPGSVTTSPNGKKKTIT